MRSTVAYASARVLLFVVSIIVLHVIGIGGFLLWALAFVISMLVSYVLLSKQRDAMSAAFAGRLANRRQRGPGQQRGPGLRGRLDSLRARLEEGARVEDQDGEAGQRDGQAGQRDGQAGQRDGLEAADRGSRTVR
jgi:hypothetical protein